MRVAILMAISVGLAACNLTPIPDSGAEATGVGFGNPNRYLAEREARNAALEGQAVAGIDGAVSPEAVVGAPLSALGTDPGSPTQTGDAATLAAQTRAALGATAGQSGLSDEQNFEAVANRETIESDRQRLEQQREQFQVVAPTAVPDRPEGSSAPNIVQYALSTANQPGQQLYNRMNLFGTRDGRNCNRYSNANEAQERFLQRGGPQRDPEGLDPDGDGFACGWDPRPFRLASQTQSGN
ncbi:MAG: hypothetical protein HRT60_08130 [Dinoroseobacter sp.]|nr:hypothetical protein [Dinoroseobacter sp.]